jgi:single-stranded DNA-binding protein
MYGRLVEEPREFKTKQGKQLVSIRVADNPTGGREDDLAWFVEVTLGEGLAKVVRERGLTKGDQVLISGQLHRRPYEKKGGGKGESHEIRFVDQFQIVRCAADANRDKGDGGGFTAAPEAEAPAGATEDPYGF